MTNLAKAYRRGRAIWLRNDLTVLFRNDATSVAGLYR